MKNLELTRWHSIYNTSLSLLCFIFIVGCSVNTPKTRYYSNFEDDMYQTQYPGEYAAQYTKRSKQVKEKKQLQQTNSPSKELPHSSLAQKNAHSLQYQKYRATNKKIPAHYKPYVVFGKEYYPLFDARGYMETGLASWYGPTFHGKKTSNGETYDMHAETAAHKTLPMGTIVRVTNIENKRSMILRINDRGPFVGDRIIDLSKTAAHKLDIYQKGTGMVKVEVVQAPPPLQASHSGTYYLQVGAFSDKDKAHSIRSSIEQKGLKTRLIPTENQRIWKVQVGPMKQLAQTVKTKELLTGDFPEAYVVME